MQTSFSDKQLENKDNKSSESIVRKCVHCGMCNATCPTYKILGDELDGPRGRIYMIKDMLENNKPANEKIVKHIHLDERARLDFDDGKVALAMDLML